MKIPRDITEPYVNLYMNPKGFIGVYLFLISGFVSITVFFFWYLISQNNIIALIPIFLGILMIATFVLLIFVVARQRILITKDFIYQGKAFGKKRFVLLCATTDVKRIYLGQFYGLDTTIVAMGIDKENLNGDEKKLFFIDYERKILASMRPFFSPELFEDLEDKM